MPKLIIEFDEEFYQAVRKAILKKYGFKKGVIKTGVTEALEQWMKRQWPIHYHLI